MIQVGKKAPDYAAPAYQQGKFISTKLSDYLGKWVLLCFYPVFLIRKAASCMEVGGRLLTRDKHFDVVDQIETIILGTFSNEQVNIILLV